MPTRSKRRPSASLAPQRTTPSAQPRRLQPAMRKIGSANATTIAPASTGMRRAGSGRGVSMVAMAGTPPGSGRRRRRSGRGRPRPGRHRGPIPPSPPPLHGRPEVPPAVFGERDEPGGEGGGGKDGAPGPEIDDRPPLGEAAAEEAMVQVRLVCRIDPLPVQEAPRDDEGRVEDGDREGEEWEEERHRGRRLQQALDRDG